MFKLVCLLALVASISATPTIHLKSLLLKHLAGHVEGPGPVYGPAPQPIAYEAQPTYYYAQPAAPVSAPAPVVVEARQAPVQAPVHHVIYLAQPQPQPQAVSYAAPAPEPVAYHAAPEPVAYHAAPAPVAYHAAPETIAYHAAPAPVAYQAAPQQVTYEAGPEQVLYKKPHGFEITKRFLF
ncbi:uncharacterized protein LOC135697882 [Ochlerotatus camptorhynchus]|uniref:uncharacterized protein LOC135697882 n=1 Tax=Ochlerotatus camptorhynchus TaxID=644619 RepID=UPI0031E2B5A3